MTPDSVNQLDLFVNFSIAGLTDVGRKRDHNEDHFFLSNFPLPTQVTVLVDANSEQVPLADSEGAALCIVADGMGGTNSGEVASEMAALGIANQINELREALVDAEPTVVERMLLEASVSVNQTLWDASSQFAELQGMGTTLTAMLALGTNAYWLQSGDSRLYRLRGGVLEILTPDQSSVGTLFQQGDITEEQARRHPYRNIIDQCMGGNPMDPFEPAAGSFALEAGDVYVLCSDGLMDGLWDAEIQERMERLRNGKSPVEVVKQLVYDAKEASGNDNITAIVGYVEPNPSKSSAAAKSVGKWIRERALGQNYSDITPNRKTI